MGDRIAHLIHRINYLNTIRSLTAQLENAERSRMVFILLAKNEGATVTEIARRCNVGRQTIYRWIDAHESTETPDNP